MSVVKRLTGRNTKLIARHGAMKTSQTCKGTSMICNPADDKATKVYIRRNFIVCLYLYGLPKGKFSIIATNRHVYEWAVEKVGRELWLDCVILDDSIFSGAISSYTQKALHFALHHHAMIGACCMPLHWRPLAIDPFVIILLQAINRRSD